jgi:hypothetical protein
MGDYAVGRVGETLGRTFIRKILAVGTYGPQVETVFAEKALVAAKYDRPLG